MHPPSHFLYYNITTRAMKKGAISDIDSAHIWGVRENDGHHRNNFFKDH